MGDRSSTIPGLARRAFLQLSVAGSGAFGVRELFAAEPQTEVEAAREPRRSLGHDNPEDSPEQEQQAFRFQLAPQRR
jgi:hypothetical protein